MAYTLTLEQQKNLRHFVINHLSSYIDEELSSEYLVTDDLVENDSWDEINARKAAAIQFIIDNL
jgi:hypothetical protein